MTPLRQRQSLWIHGAGLSGATWHDLCADLPLSRMPDLPGHGHADAVMPPRVERYAEALTPLLDSGMVLVGHSLGGMVALELAARSLVPLGALILVEAVATVRDRWLGRVGPRLARLVLPQLPKGVLVAMSAMGQSHAASVEARRGLSLMQRNEILDVFDAARLYDGRRHLERIRIPTLILVGTRNTATHRGARLLADRIAGARLVALSGGHLLHIDNPNGLRREIEGFLSGARRVPNPK